MKLLNKTKTTITKKAEKIKGKVSCTAQKIRILGTAIATALMTGYVNVYAADAAGAWNTTMQTVVPWIQKIGIVLIVFGAVEFAIANSSEDANQKIRATRFMVSGAIVVAVASAVGPMLYS